MCLKILNVQMRLIPLLSLSQLGVIYYAEVVPVVVNEIQEEDSHVYAELVMMNKEGNIVLKNTKISLSVKITTVTIGVDHQCISITCNAPITMLGRTSKLVTIRS